MDFLRSDSVSAPVSHTRSSARSLPSQSLRLPFREGAEITSTSRRDDEDGHSASKHLLPRAYHVLSIARSVAGQLLGSAGCKHQVNERAGLPSTKHRWRTPGEGPAPPPGLTSPGHGAAKRDAAFAVVVTRYATQAGCPRASHGPLPPQRHAGLLAGRPRDTGRGEPARLRFPGKETAARLLCLGACSRPVVIVVTELGDRKTRARAQGQGRTAPDSASLYRSSGSKHHRH